MLLHLNPVILPLNHTFILACFISIISANNTVYAWLLHKHCFCSILLLSVLPLSPPFFYTSATNTLIQHNNILNGNSITEVAAPLFSPPSIFLHPSLPACPRLCFAFLLLLLFCLFFSRTTIGKSSETGLIVIQCLLLPVLFSSRQPYR